MLTPHCSAASGIVVPPSIVSTTRLRKSAEYGFAIHAGLFPAGSLNHIRAAMGIPDSAFPGNALAADFRLLKPGYQTQCPICIRLVTFDGGSEDPNIRRPLRAA